MNSFSGNTVVDNLVNGKPLVYLEDVSDLAVADAGQVILVNCSRIRVENLNLSNTDAGVQLWKTDNSTITGNTMTFNEYGIWLSSSSDNTVSRNTITSNYGHGAIYIEGSSNNAVSFNNITSNKRDGVKLISSNNNTICGNNITNNGNGVDLEYSSYNTVSFNNITSHRWASVWLYPFSNYNTIYGNNIWNNTSGVQITGSSYNTVSFNNITSNTMDGIALNAAFENSFYHNNFINNTIQAYVVNSDLINWDDGYPSGGNYWSDYNGTDSNSDGIGDTPYILDPNNTDHYPLIGTISKYNATLEHSIQVICNSTISAFQFNGTAISFDVTGEDGSAAFCRICIPLVLIDGEYRIFVNGTEISYNLLPVYNSALSYLYFTYEHSTKEIVIIPEFPSITLLSLFLVGTLLAALIHRKSCLFKLE